MAATPHRYAAGHRLVREPVAVVVQSSPTRTAAAAARWFARDDSSASAHAVVDASGAIDVVDLDDRAWHAGRGASLGELSGEAVNGRTLAIDVVGLGRIRPPRGETLEAVPMLHGMRSAYAADDPGRLALLVGPAFDRFGRPYAGPVYIADDGSAWTPFERAAILAAASWVGRALARFPRLRQDTAVRGGGPWLLPHDAVNRGAGPMPGPAFPLHTLARLATELP